MNGVEVLTSNEVAVTHESFNWGGFWITIAVVAFGALIFGLIAAIDTKDKTFGVSIFLIGFIISGLVFGPIVGFGTCEPVKYETQYKITIDDSVSMIEFLDKYEIIDQDGKIYIVRERE